MTTAPPPGAATCSHMSTCELFPRFQLQGPLQVWRLFYCHADFHRCARYQRSLEGKEVPPLLLPNGKMLDIQMMGMAP